MDETKAASQAKLVNKLMQAISTNTALTAIEVLGAIEVCKAQVTFTMMMAPPPSGVPSTSREAANGGIIKP